MKNTILIVDDDMTNLTALTQILQKEYAIYEASDGKTAIRLAEEHLPDLILLDVLMPDMDGFQLFAHIQNTAKISRIPVMFITGLNSIEDELKGLELGAVDYIHKPFYDKIVRLRVRHQIQIINQLRTIESLSMIDQLTDIPNRRNFDNRMEAEWGRAVRENFPISFLLIDVDHFKQYNDTHGHQQGDSVLCVIAQAIVRTLKRTTDFAARWGGEEFAVLLPNTDAGGGLEIGEQIRQNIEAIEMPLEDGSFSKVTASIGIYTQKPTQYSSVSEFFSKADEALYEAKKTGRNKVCCNKDDDRMYGYDDDDILDIDVSDINIPGIDAEAGTSLYSGEMDIYIAVLKSFSANIPAAVNKMRAVSGERLHEYATTVHGLKGSCASIGAEDLREKALDLEMKSKAGDLSGVLALNGSLIREAEELLINIRTWLDEFIDD